jgi:MerE protein
VTDVRERGTGKWEVESGAEDVARVRSGANRGLAWVMGSFVFCPCHLPLTLGLAAAVLAGTAAGAMLRQHPVMAGVAVTLVWAVGTARGLWLLRYAAGRARSD